MKVCIKCESTKPNSSFYKSSPNICKVCKLEENKTWRNNNEDKRKASVRISSLKRNFGITPEQYNKMFSEQNGCCAICDRHQDLFNKRLAVDHNHHTGEIRGLLCNYCNHRVVGRHRDGELLRKIADYIEQGTGWFVPKKKKTVKRKPKRK